jgi:hypothetical protein
MHKIEVKIIFFVRRRKEGEGIMGHEIAKWLRH